MTETKEWEAMVEVWKDNERLRAELAAERERVMRLRRLAKYAPGYHYNARSYEEREATKACDIHGDFDEA